MSAPKSDRTIEEIIGGSVTNEAAADWSVISPDDYEVLADKVELLLADLGELKAYPAASAEYVTAFTAEINWHRKVRAWVASACGFIILSLLFTLGGAIRHREEWFGNDAGHALTALVIATVGGTVVITNAVAKAVFAPISERNAGLPMPEHLKTLWEGIQTITGK